MDNFSITKPLNEEEYKQLLRQAVAVLPWSHNLLLMGYNLSSEHVELVNELKTNKKQMKTNNNINLKKNTFKLRNRQ